MIPDRMKVAVFEIAVMAGGMWQARAEVKPATVL
jgi:hypothetical protein